MSAIFKPEDKVVNDLFARDVSYIIPEYQRPYSWDCLGKTEQNNQINLMWDDLFHYYNTSLINGQFDSSKPYFLGSMIMVEKANRTYEVIDGQQRLTSLTLLFVGIKCFLQEAKNLLNTTEDRIESFRQTVEAAISRNIDEIIYNIEESGLNSEKKVKIERSIGFDYDSILETVMACGNVITTNLSSEEKTIVSKYVNNKNYFQNKLKEHFLSDDGTFTELNYRNLSQFVSFLKNGVTVIRIIATDFDVAYHVFEIMNNRGLQLSSKDLLRNFIIKEFALLNGAINPHEKWIELEENYILDNYFISRYVESSKKQNARTTAFNDLKSIYSNYLPTATQSKIEVFYADFKEDLNAYTLISERNFTNVELKDSINFLLNTGNGTYTYNLLLALFRYSKDESIQLEFVKYYERYIIHFLLGTSRRFQQKPIYDAIKCLDNKQFDLAVQLFDLTNENKEQLFSSISNNELDNEIGKLLLFKYVTNNLRLNNDATANVILNFDKLTLEHIIPQNPVNDSNWVMEFTVEQRKRWTYKLGNMTLLDQRMNSAAKNYDFNRKQTIYAQAILPITNEMSSSGFLMDATYIEERHRRITEQLIRIYNF